MARKVTHHAVTRHYDFGDHRQMANYWASELRWSVRQAVANPRPATINDLDMLHAVRSARMWHYHATRIRKGATR